MASSTHLEAAPTISQATRRAQLRQEGNTDNCMPIVWYDIEANAFDSPFLDLYSYSEDGREFCSRGASAALGRSKSSVVFVMGLTPSKLLVM